MRVALNNTAQRKTNDKSTPVKLTSRGQYSISAMLNLAKHHDSAPVPLTDIAENSNISLSYLEQLVSALRKNDLVKSYRGPGGGYVLNHPPSSILVSDILKAAEDSMPARKSRKDATEVECPLTLALWDHIGHYLDAHLSTITLDDLMNRRF